jgi:hypothetical protein
VATATPPLAGHRVRACARPTLYKPAAQLFLLLHLPLRTVCPSCRTERSTSSPSTPSAPLRYVSPHVALLTPPVLPNSYPAIAIFFSTLRRRRIGGPLLTLSVCTGRCHIPGKLGSPGRPYGHGPGGSRCLQQVHDLQPQEPRLGQPRPLCPLVRISCDSPTIQLRSLRANWPAACGVRFAALRTSFPFGYLGDAKLGVLSPQICKLHICGSQQRFRGSPVPYRTWLVFSNFGKIGR